MKRSQNGISSTSVSLFVSFVETEGGLSAKPLTTVNSESGYPLDPLELPGFKTMALLIPVQ